jgi:hypothetical protein
MNTLYLNPANFKLHLVLSLTIPLIIGYLIIWKYLDKKWFNYKLYPDFDFSIILFICPIIYVLINVYTTLKTKQGPTYAFPACVTEKNISEDDKKNGILALFDIQCHNDHNNMTFLNGREFENRFYYLSYVLFLIIIFIAPLKSPNKNFHYGIITLISLSLLISLLGSVIATSFFGMNYPTLHAQYAATSLLVLDAALVLITLIYVFTSLL